MRSDRIDAFLKQLSRELRKKGVFDQRMIEEARDHLADAVDAGLQSGSSADDAVRDALERFGSPEAFVQCALEERRRPYLSAILDKTARALSMPPAVALARGLCLASPAAVLLLFITLETRLGPSALADALAALASRTALQAMLGVVAPGLVLGALVTAVTMNILAIIRVRFRRHRGRLVGSMVFQPHWPNVVFINAAVLVAVALGAYAYHQRLAPFDSTRVALVEWPADSFPTGVSWIGWSGSGYRFLSPFPRVSDDEATSYEILEARARAQIKAFKELLPAHVPRVMADRVVFVRRQPELPRRAPPSETPAQ